MRNLICHEGGREEREKNVKQEENLIRNLARVFCELRNENMKNVDEIYKAARKRRVGGK